MRRALLIGLLFFPGIVFSAPLTQTKYSPFTGTLDFITRVDSQTVKAGSGITVVDTSSGVTVAATGSSASSLEVYSNYGGGSSSPTASIQIGKGMKFVVSGSTAQVDVDFSSVTSRADAILNQATLQSGATFYVSSGTVEGQFSISDTVNGRKLQIYPGVTDYGNGSFTMFTQPVSVFGSYAPFRVAVSTEPALSISGNNADVSSIYLYPPGNATFPLGAISFESGSIDGFTIGPNSGMQLGQSLTMANHSGIFGIGTSQSQFNAAGDLIEASSATFKGQFQDANGSPGSSGQIWTSQGAGSAAHWTTVSGGSGNQVSLSTGVTGILPAANGSVIGSTVGITIAIEGGGSAIVAGSTRTVEIPYAFTISSWTVVAPLESGSISVHISSASYANFPTLYNVSGAGNSPSLSSAQKNTAAVSGWSQTTFAAHTIIGAVVDSASTVTDVEITLEVWKG